MDNETNSEGASSKDGGKMKVGDKVWVRAEVIDIEGSSVRVQGPLCSGAFWVVKRDCKPVEPEVVEQPTKKEPTEAQKIAERTLKAIWATHPKPEPEPVEQTETVGPEPICVGDKVTWNGHKGIVSEWCKQTQKFRFQADNGAVIWVFESSLSRVEPDPVIKESLNTESDPVNPSHYKQGSIECIEAIKAALGVGFIAYLWGNIMKYLWRWPNKNGIEDLKKARWYLDRLIQEEEAK